MKASRLTSHPPLSERPAPQPLFRTIVEDLRSRISRGDLVVGDKLPSTAQLMRTWNSSSFTVHTALKRLIREGWIQSIPGSGTFVAPTQNRFSCAGIYFENDIFSYENASYARALNVSLVRQMARLKKETLLFIDTRPEQRQAEVLPALAEAIRQRQIQALIGATTNFVSGPVLERLTLPFVSGATRRNRRQVTLDPAQFLGESARRLASQGCRSVGLITHILKLPPAEYAGSFHDLFAKATARHQLTTHPEWTRFPRHYAPNFERQGYDFFRKIWKGRNQPEGLIVYPDIIARGVITAVLEIGLEKVTSRMKFAFHRNQGLDVICPFPAIWAVTDIDTVAAEMIRMIERQFDGEKITPVLLGYSFED